MRVLTGNKLREFVEKNIENYVDLDVQIQQVGIDFTLKRAASPVAWGIIDFDNKSRVIANQLNIGLTRSAFPDLSLYLLRNSSSYVLWTNEIIHLDKKHFAIAYPRSSLTRNGVVFSSAIADPGYVGDLHFTVYTPIDLYLTENARIAQIIIYELDQDAPEYNGIYKYHGVDSHE